MATRTASSTRNSKAGTSRSRSRTSTENSAFQWGSTGAVVGAALGGAALAIAANLGRKLAMQGLSAAKGDWDQSLAAEHEAVLALFDKMLATDESQTMQRKLMLMQLGHALDKHSYAEEHVIYPALRESNDVADAEHLEVEHGEVKEFLYRLHGMKTDAPEWLETIREFRQSVAAHARMEEDQVFPQLKAEAGEELNAKLTKEVNRAGFMMA